jgi:hypothetical protein
MPFRYCVNIRGIAYSDESFSAKQGRHLDSCMASEATSRKDKDGFAGLNSGRILQSKQGGAKGHW